MRCIDELFLTNTLKIKDVYTYINMGTSGVRNLIFFLVVCLLC